MNIQLRKAAAVVRIINKNRMKSSTELCLRYFKSYNILTRTDLGSSIIKIVEAREAEIGEIRRNEKVSDKFGNCGEMNLFAMTALSQLGVLSKTIMLDLKPGIAPGNHDHSFLVTNFSKGMKVDNLRTWGPQAIIVDPWLNFSARLQDGLLRIDNELSNFNPFEKNNNLDIGKRFLGYFSDRYFITERPMANKYSLKLTFEKLFKGIAERGISR